MDLSDSPAQHESRPSQDPLTNQISPGLLFGKNEITGCLQGEDHSIANGKPAQISDNPSPSVAQQELKNVLSPSSSEEVSQKTR